jgi:hypothetical protein
MKNDTGTMYHDWNMAVKSSNRLYELSYRNFQGDPGQPEKLFAMIRFDIRDTVV